MADPRSFQSAADEVFCALLEAGLHPSPQPAPDPWSGMLPFEREEAS